MPGKFGHVFCLEGDWAWDFTDRTSVRPLLELLERMRRINFVHKDVGTRAELQHYLAQWAEYDTSVRDYFTLYLAFPGGERERERERGSGVQRTIWLSDADDGEITLRELAAMLGDRLQGRRAADRRECRIPRDRVLRAPLRLSSPP